MKIHEYPLKVGINHTKEFEKKQLASFAVNCGIKCGHDCLYCSSGALLRTHPAFKTCGETPFGHGYAIVDPTTPDRVAKDAKRMRKRGLIQLCTITDAWAPEAKKHEIGRRCLETILAEPGWQVRILTKNASIIDDFDLIEKHRDRVLVGLSITATPDNDEIINIVEPNASSIRDRMRAMTEAAAMGLRTYAMFCPLLPGIANSPEQIDQLIEFATECKVEEIFVEPVNARGKGLIDCQTALELWGYEIQAKAIENIRKQANWSKYVRKLIHNVQQSIYRYSDINKLRFLLYSSRLLSEDIDTIRQDDQGVIWLGK